MWASQNMKTHKSQKSNIEFDRSDEMWGKVLAEIHFNNDMKRGKMFLKW